MIYLVESGRYVEDHSIDGAYASPELAMGAYPKVAWIRHEWADGGRAWSARDPREHDSITISGWDVVTEGPLGEAIETLVHDT